MIGISGLSEDKDKKLDEIKTTVIKNQLKTTKIRVGEQLKIAFDEEGDSIKEGDDKDREPIIKNGGIYNRLEMTEKDREFFYNFAKNAVFIDYSIDPEKAKRQGFKSAGKGTYIISRIDSENKYSKEFYDCTSVCGIGVDKITGELISFLSHQNPEGFLKDSLADFENDLNNSLDEILERCLAGSIDFVILGGNKSVSHNTNINSFEIEKMNPQQIAEIFDKDSNNSFETYRKSIAFISRIIFEKIKSYPRVITGPNNNISIDDYKERNALDVYLDTKNKLIYQIRPKNQSIYDESFMGNEINDKIINFQKT